MDRAIDLIRDFMHFSNFMSFFEKFSYNHPIYLDTLKNQLIAGIKKFGFIDPVDLNKLYYKYCQDNDPKHKSYLCKSWLLYNSTQNY